MAGAGVLSVGTVTVAPRPKIACHERAHAIVGMALRLPIEEVHMGDGVRVSMDPGFLG